MQENKAQRYYRRLHAKNGLDLTSKQLIDEFIKECNAKRLSIFSIRTYLSYLNSFANFCNKSFYRVNRGDFINYMIYCGENFQSKGTVARKVKFLKSFIKWCNPQAEIWLQTIKPQQEDHHKTPEEMLSEDQISELADKATNLRNKLIIWLAFDGALRPKELRALKIKNLVKDKHGYSIIVYKSKTFPRRVRLQFERTHKLLDGWLAAHPSPENDEFLFTQLASTKPINDDTIRKELYRISKKAGIHFNLYLARHSGATHKAQFLNSKELNAFLGHSPSSQMADIYIHFSGKEFDHKLIQNKKPDVQASQEFFRFYEAYQSFQVYQETRKKIK